MGLCGYLIEALICANGSVVASCVLSLTHQLSCKWERRRNQNVLYRPLQQRAGGGGMRRAPLQALVIIILTLLKPQFKSYCLCQEEALALNKGNSYKTTSKSYCDDEGTNEQKLVISNQHHLLCKNVLSDANVNH